MSFTRGDSPESDDLEAHRPLDHDPSRGRSPTNDDDIFTAGEGQAPFRGRKRQEDSCLCAGVEGPNGVFTNTRSRSSSGAPEARNGSEMKKARDTRLTSRSSSRVPEARNGSDSSKAQTKKADDTEKSSKPSSASGAKAADGEHQATKKKHSKSEGLGPVPTFRYYPFNIDKIPSGTCDRRHTLVPLKPHDIKNQGDM